MGANVTAHPDGIHTVDAGYVRPRAASIHVLVERGHAVIVDTGTLHSVPRVLDALAALGVARDAVDHVILTHVHLDHAGGAGGLVRELPRADVLVHPRAAAHVIDPGKLVAGSIAVYGEERFRELYGEIVPIDAARVRTLDDGERVDFQGRVLEAWHTPGHAMHHQCIALPGERVIFTGDTLGMAYPDLETPDGPFIVPTTTPTQFDAGQLKESIRRIVAFEPRAAYLTHYGRVTGIERLAAQLIEQIDAFVDIARRHAAAPADEREPRIRADMRRLWLDSAARLGVRATPAEVERLLDADLDLNAQGLVAWLDRLARG